MISSNQRGASETITMKVKDTPVKTKLANKPPQNHENNKLRDDDRPAHGWYRFVLSFPPHLVRKYLEGFGVDSRHRILDPFCGTGTTLVECKKHCVESIGIEANPVACFASRVKSDWSVDPSGLLKHAQMIAKIASEKINAANLKCSTMKTQSQLDHVRPDYRELLIKNSISPLPLLKTFILLDTIEAKKDNRFYDHERLALAKSLVFEISNLHFGPEVGVGEIKSDAPVVAAWLHEIQLMTEDLMVLKEKPVTKVTVFQADSRNLVNLLGPNSIDAVITSPPYPNEKDYTRTTRLESVLLGFINNKHDLRALKQSLVRSNTRGVFKADDDEQSVANFPEIEAISEAIEKRRITLGKTSGFERLYGRVVRLYFGGMARHLSNLRMILRPGAQLAYVVGDQASYLRVMIRTGTLLAKVARTLGYDVIGLDLFRTRIATATKEQLREEVLLLRWPG